MSINVTVTGNPVSIKRGKMVTADPHTAKKEFDKRRLLRLEQVRQQSKELAEDVRNKVRTEKKKQMGQIEKEGKEKLKNWQNRKLLELQNQYLNALDEIGLAHKEAEQLQDENQILEEQKLHNEEIAKSRGRLAETKQQVRKNEENYKKSVPIQQKKLVRDIENTRATLVASMGPKEANKKCKAKKRTTQPATDINISIPNDSDFSEASTSSSDSSKHHSNVELEDQAQDSEGFCECSDSSDGRRHGLSLIAEETTYRENNESIAKQVPYVQKTTPPQKSYRETIEDHKKTIDSFRSRPRNVPVDTRISDRIKQRQLAASQPDYCDVVVDGQGSNLVDERIRNKDPLDLSSGECLCSKFHNSCPCAPSKSAAVQADLDRKSCKCNKAYSQSAQVQTSSPPKDIPSKPAVKLKDVEQAARSTSTNVAAKVRHYDYPNRFERDLPSTSQVEKIQADSIEVIPDSNSEIDRFEKMKQRDLDALARGRRALEKEKIQKDYQEMMKKLPALQRKEHIARIGTDKPEFHMSEERLKERERERQNRLENAYSKAIPDLKPQIVTIPSRKHEIPTNDEPFEILDGDDSRTLNLAKWDTDTKPKTMFSAEEVQEIIKAFTMQKPEDRKAKLKHLLKSLKLQKEQLINEIRALPRDDSINALISDLSSFSDLSPSDKHKKRGKSERKRRREESDTSGSATEPSLRARTSKTKNKKSPHKKIKKVLILQNTSTQTTPKPTKEKSSSTTTTITSSTSVQAPEEATIKSLPEGIRICTKSHTPCDCFKDKEAKSSEEVCKIFIKLNEEEAPKVEVVRSTQVVEDKEQESKLVEKKKPIKTKSVATETEPSPPSKIKSNAKPSRVLVDKSKQESWKEHFSKNSILSNSSTSYLSPPDFSRQNTTGSTEASKLSLYNLRSKPKQTNTIRSLSQQTTNEDLLNYVKRLLSMSRNSIEDLGVSSSDVQTPSQSVIEIESNNPLAALHSMVKLINLRAADVSKELSASADDVPAPPNSFVNASDQTGQDSSCNDKAKELLFQYADVTDSCAKRIANLAAMIEQLRQEKIEMLQTSPLVGHGSRSNSPPCSDKEYSTKYMEFPPFEERSKGTNSTGSMDEEELNRRLLDIDMSLAEKLKRFRQEDKNGDDEGVEDQQFLQRLQRLVQDQQPEPAPKPEEPFVPFLIDIPKLPILEPEPKGGQVRRHPPPSKGLTSAKKFNGDISLMPHELSTIIEAESQLSTKLSPNASKIEKSPLKFSNKLEPSESSKSLTCTEGTCPNLVSSSSSSKLSSSSSSSSDLKNIEAMLKSIGMDWAIPTLHKTQEALALTSSSSSGNLSSKKKSVEKSTSISEVSLKDFLKKQMISKISSSSLNRSDASPASFMRECSEISAIQASSSAEKAKQRTSTPVLTSKSTSKSHEDQQQLFTGASDISSVKNNSSASKSSGKPTFRSLAGDEGSSLT